MRKSKFPPVRDAQIAPDVSSPLRCSDYLTSSLRSKIAIRRASHAPASGLRSLVPHRSPAVLWATILLVAIPCGFAQSASQPSAQSGSAVLWVDPGAISSRNLLYG